MASSSLPVGNSKPPTVYLHPRGICTGCGREKTLNQDGLIHKHNSLSGQGHCSGSRELSKAANT